jgi:hypothetical protein
MMPTRWLDHQSGGAVHWERLSGVRTLVLSLAAVACIAVGAFLIYVPAGWISLGVLLFVLEALTGDTTRSPRSL